MLSVSFRGAGPDGVPGDVVHTFADFRPTGGLTLPFAQSTSLNGEGNATGTLSAVTVNAAVDDALWKRKGARRRDAGTRRRRRCRLTCLAADDRAGPGALGRRRPAARHRARSRLRRRLARRARHARLHAPRSSSSPRRATSRPRGRPGRTADVDAAPGDGYGVALVHGLRRARGEWVLARRRRPARARARRGPAVGGARSGRDPHRLALRGRRDAARCRRCAAA